MSRHITDRGLTQEATLWRSSPDRFGGDVFAPPIAIKCRWEDRTERFRSQIDNDEHVSAAIVHLDRSASVGDYLFPGPTTEPDPTSLPGSYKIQRFDNIPDFRNLLVNRKAYL